MCVYFIQAEQGGLIKIGLSKHPLTRLEDIQRFCPIKLKLIGIVKNASYTTEQSIQYDFRQFRQYGEWFEPVPSLKQFIIENAQPVEYGNKIDLNGSNFVERRGVIYKRCIAISKTKNRRCLATATHSNYCTRHWKMLDKP